MDRARSRWRPPPSSARALWIVPVTLGLGWLHGSRRAGTARRASRPWFILGFVAIAAVTTLLPALRPAGHLVAEIAKRALVLTLFLVGAGLSRDALRQVGARPLVLGLALWLGIASASLAAVRPFRSTSDALLGLAPLPRRASGARLDRVRLLVTTSCSSATDRCRDLRSPSGGSIALPGATGSPAGPRGVVECLGNSRSAGTQAPR